MATTNEISTKRERILADLQAAEAKLIEMRTALGVADEAEREAGIVSTLEPGQATEAALERARRGRQRLVDALDAGRDRAQLLAAALQRLDEEARAAAADRDKARRAEARQRLAARIEADAPAFRRFVEQIVAADWLVGQGGIPAERVLDVASSLAGTSPTALTFGGRELAMRFIRGEEA